MDYLDIYSITINFIMPMVFKDNVKYSDITTSFYNTYLSIYDKPEYDDKIIVEVHSTIDLNRCRPNLFVKKITTDESKLYIFNIPKEFKDDVYLIIGGKYSHISQDYKHKLLYFWSKDKDCRLFNILYKNKRRFTKNEYLLNKTRIDNAEEYYTKPLYKELIYGLQI